MKTRRTALSSLFAILIGIGSFGLSEAAEVTFIPRVPEPAVLSLRALLEDHVSINIKDNIVTAELLSPAENSDVIIEALPRIFMPVIEKFVAYLTVSLTAYESIILAQEIREVPLVGTNRTIRVTVKLVVDPYYNVYPPDIPAVARDLRIKFITDILSAMENDKSIKFYGRLFVGNLYDGKSIENAEQSGITVWLVTKKIEF